MAQQIVLTVTDDGWWGWICATHGEAAFLHKTKRRAAIEAAIEAPIEGPIETAIGGPIESPIESPIERFTMHATSNC